MPHTTEEFEKARKHWSECARCNYDRHQCPGCGEPIPHGYSSCPECASL